MIQDILPRYQETADGSKKTFTVPFDVLGENYVIVYKNDSKQTSGYSLSGNTITFTTAPANNTLITIQRVVPVEWTSNNYGALSPETLGNILTRIVAEIQTVKEEVDRAPKTEVYDQENGSSISAYFFSQMRQAVDILEQFKALAESLEELKDEVDSYIETASSSTITYINNMVSDKIGEYNQNATEKTNALNERVTYLEEVATDAEFVYDNREKIAFCKEWPNNRL